MAKTFAELYKTADKDVLERIVENAKIYQPAAVQAATAELNARKNAKSGAKANGKKK